MKFKIFPFGIGIILFTLGLIVSGYIFEISSKETKNITLGISDSGSVSIKLEGKGLGFYFITSNNYQNNILVKVLDSSGNLLDIKKITNKATINYFHFEHSDQVTLELSNLSDIPVQVSMTIGDTKFDKVILPILLMILGTSFLIFSGYRKLKNYIIAQPDENSS